MLERWCALRSVDAGVAVAAAAAAEIRCWRRVALTRAICYFSYTDSVSDVLLSRTVLRLRCAVPARPMRYRYRCRYTHAHTHSYTWYSHNLFKQILLEQIINAPPQPQQQQQQNKKKKTKKLCEVRQTKQAKKRKKKSKSICKIHPKVVLQSGGSVRKVELNYLQY